MQEGSQVYSHGSRVYTSNVFNQLDVLIILMLLVSIALRYVLVEAGTTHTEYISLVDILKVRSRDLRT